MEYRNSMMSRMFVLFTLLLIFPAGIILQMVRVGIFHGEGYRDLWSTQAMDFISIPAERGNIYDQNGALLASNRVNYNVAVDPLRSEEHTSELQSRGTIVCRLL